MATYSVDHIIEMLRAEPGPQCARFADILEREKKQNGLLKMSLGTWAPGHPTSVEEWAKELADGHEALMSGDYDVIDLDDLEDEPPGTKP